MTLNGMLPTGDQAKNQLFSQESLFFIFGVADGSTYLLIYLIGPLLVAANHRKTYEVTMGGTMISVCIAFAFVFGSCLGMIFLAIGLASPLQVQRLMIFTIQLAAALPFLLPAVDDM